MKEQYVELVSRDGACYDTVKRLNHVAPHLVSNELAVFAGLIVDIGVYLGENARVWQLCEDFMLYKDAIVGADDLVARVKATYHEWCEQHREEEHRAEYRQKLESIPEALWVQMAHLVYAYVVVN